MIANRCLPLVALCALALPAAAQTANVKPPKVQLWMDLSTGGMAGMPEMTGLPAGIGGLFGGGASGGAKQAYGAARGMNVMPPRVLDIALFNSLRPGVPAQQLVPAGLRMGDALPLIPPQAVPREREPGEVSQDMRPETPKGRILIYWGCGEAVRRGQPRVVDLARGNPSEMASAFSGRFAPDRGARVGPQHALYPNEQARLEVPQGASLVGEHRVQGDGVPASMKFALDAAQDLMPAIDLQTRGQVTESMGLSWRTVPQARAYFLHAMGQVGNDLVMWSSAETGDTGMGLFDYLPNATIDRWLRENVLLKPETTACAVPKGIFAGEAVARDGSGAMVRMVAYGSESNFVHPPRPADPRAAWEPEWAVRVRVKAHTMALLGGEQQARGAPATSEPAAGAATPAAAPANPVQGVLDAVVPGGAGLLRGLFGR